MKQDIPKPEELMGGHVLLLFSQMPGCSEELIFRSWCKVDSEVEEVKNEVTSADGVVIFSVIYRELQAKLKYFH